MNYNYPENPNNQQNRQYQQVPSADEWSQEKQKDEEQRLNNFSQQPNNDNGEYDGQTDNQGQRQGKGTCIYHDGSQYEGEWLQNKRHGKGKLSTSQRYYFEGYWFEDQRKGKGIEILPSGEKFETIWEQDRKHGEGTYTDNNGHIQQVNFNWDLMLPKDNLGHGTRWQLNFILFIITLIWIPIAIFVDEQYYWGFGIFYFFLMIEAISSSTRQYLDNLQPASQLRNILMNAKNCKPGIQWTIQNYHYETRFRQVIKKDSEGNETTKTESYQERINTHYASSEYTFRYWCDLSPPEYSLDFIKSFPLTRLKMDRQISLSPQAFSDCQIQKDIFTRNHIRDVRYDLNENQKFPGALKYTLMFNDETGFKPWYAMKRHFWLLSIFGLGWILRIQIQNNSKKVEFHCNKYIYY